MQDKKEVDVNTIPKGTQCLECEKLINIKDNQVVLKACPPHCLVEVHKNFSHWDCLERRYSRNVPEMEEFSKLGVFNLRMEISTHMDSLEKIDVKTLPKGTECPECCTELSDVKDSVVIRPCPLRCWYENHGYFHWDCYESWIMDEVKGYAHRITDINDDFRKFKANDAQENEEVEEKVKTLLYKISSHLIDI